MSLLKRFKLSICAICALFLSAASGFGQEFDASAYRVAWDSPSETLGGTMPLGNGELCVNAWFEPQARVQLVFGRTDSWDEFGRLAKVGAVEVNFLGDGFARRSRSPLSRRSTRRPA